MSPQPLASMIRKSCFSCLLPTTVGKLGGVPPRFENLYRTRITPWADLSFEATLAITPAPSTPGSLNRPDCGSHHDSRSTAASFPEVHRQRVRTSRFCKQHPHVHALGDRPERFVAP